VTPTPFRPFTNALLVDTIERNILDLAVRQGLSLYTKDHATETLDVTAFASESQKVNVDKSVKKKAQKGDFIFRYVLAQPDGCLGFISRVLF
jgi:hypothetical protein